jgi:predicted dehydrogenase
MTNIALIGCGRGASLHMLAYKYIQDANIVAVSDINLDKAKAFAQTYSIKKLPMTTMRFSNEEHRL